MPAAPEMLGDNVGAPFGLIEGDQVQQLERPTYLGHYNRHGHLKCVGNKVRSALFEQFLSIAGNGLLRRQGLSWITDLGDERTVGHAFDIKDQVSYGFLFGQHAPLFARFSFTHHK